MTFIERINCLFFILLVQNTKSWNSAGHMITASIAEDYLSKHHPDTLQLVYKSLSSLNQFFKESESSLIEASVIPDYLNFDFNGFLMYYHYTNYPNVYKNDNPDFPTTAIFEYGIEYAFKSAINIIKDAQNQDPSNSSAVKNGFMDSLMLRYLIHITGDSHQPLHSTHLYASEIFNKTLTNGDVGGNLIPVMDIFGKNLTKLHSLWDSCLGLYDEFKELPLNSTDQAKIEDFAKDLTSAYPEDYFSDAIKVIDMSKWIKQSHNLAVELVYSDIDIFPILTPQYIMMGRDLCRKQLTLAGYRLAVFLNELFKDNL
jgi:hypothetical protein